MVISLHNKDIALDIDPQRGGGILRFDWRAKPVLRPAQEDDNEPLGLANFILAPFSNRIAKGNFLFDGQSVIMAPNYPPASAHHAIHGHGWMATWNIVGRTDDALHLRYQYTADSWPWTYVCDQKMTLTPDGYIHALSITNLSETSMPAGLGFHPYFPRTGAKLQTVFSGFWAVTEDGLPSEWIDKPGPYNLSHDDPVDTVFTGRKTALHINWPSHRLTMTPHSDLPETHIFAPAGKDYFCVEPISHITDAANRGGLRKLAPRETWSTQVEFSVTGRD